MLLLKHLSASQPTQLFLAMLQLAQLLLDSWVITIMERSYVLFLPVTHLMQPTTTLSQQPHKYISDLTQTTKAEYPLRELMPLALIPPELSQRHLQWLLMVLPREQLTVLSVPPLTAFQSSQDTFPTLHSTISLQSTLLPLENCLTMTTMISLYLHQAT